MSHRIPNPLVLAVALLFFPAAYFAGLSASTIAVHIGVAIAALVVAWVSLRGQLGIVKLFSAISLWIGADISLLAFIMLAGGSIGLFSGLSKIIGKPRESWPFLPFAGVAFAVVFAFTPIGAALNAALIA